jgi:CRISPR-associated protein Cmr2
MIDYFAWRAQQLSAQMAKLEREEQNRANAEQARDRDAVNAAEQRIGNIVKPLATSNLNTDPHLLHAWAEAGGFKTTAEKVRDVWKKDSGLSAGSELFRAFAFVPDVSQVGQLPPYSFAWYISFALANPYLSKDDTDFYIIDNPLRKEWVFKVPMVAATGWKGAVLAALRQRGYAQEIERLFGTIRDNEEGEAGCLYFYSTCFKVDAIGLEVINPHERETGIGARGPILFECVPAGSRGVFTCVYVPRSPAKAAVDAAADLPLLAEGLAAMLGTYGFGAKTSSGYGLVEPRSVKAWLYCNAELPTLTAQGPGPSQRPSSYGIRGLHGLQNLAGFVADFLREEGTK